MKTCCTCRKPKALSEFNRHASARDGLQPRCRSCQKDNNGLTASKAVRQAYKLLSRYGLTVQQYDELLFCQDGVCKICKRPSNLGKRLDVDHDHGCCSGEFTCGQCIRGLLCRRCNTLIGQAEEDPELLLSMIEYLEN